MRGRNIDKKNSGVDTDEDCDDHGEYTNDDDADADEGGGCLTQCLQRCTAVTSRWTP